MNKKKSARKISLLHTLFSMQRDLIVGGQAVMEGVMMRTPSAYAICWAPTSDDNRCCQTYMRTQAIMIPTVTTGLVADGLSSCSGMTTYGPPVPERDRFPGGASTMGSSVAVAIGW